MSNYSTLKAAISAVIKENNNHEITGQVLQTTLLAMVDSLAGGYLFKGVATPATVVGTPDENVFYIGGGGLYSNFGATPVHVPDGCIGIFTYNGSFKNHIIPTGGVFDISAYNAVGGTPATYANLQAALGTNGANIPDYLRKGGMSVKFIQGNAPSSDNMYVQYRLMPDEWSTNVTDWQGADDIRAISGEKSQLNIVDKSNYAILRLLSYLLVDNEGNIKTKNFNSAEQAIIKSSLDALSTSFANTFPEGEPSSFSVVDEYGYSILRLLSYLQVDENGNLITKSFDSSEIKTINNDTETFSVTDPSKNAILKIDNKGHIKTKAFDSSKFIVVDINGKGDYTSLEDAINNAGDSYNDNIDKTIIVMPGTYNMTEIATSETAAKFGHRSLNIIGVDREKCIIRGDNGYYSSGGSVGFVDSAPLKLSGNCYIANLTIISTDDNFQKPSEDTGTGEGNHTAYCIHIDYPNYGRWTFHIDNCILINDHYACIGCGLRGKLIVTNCIMECTMYNPNQVRGCIYAHDSGVIDVPDYDNVEVLVKDCILTGHSGYPLTFYAIYHKTMHLTFINNVAINDLGNNVLLYDSTYQDKTKYCFGNNNSELNY